MRKLLIALSACFHLHVACTQSWQPLPVFPGISRDDAVAEVVNQYGFIGTGFGTGFIYLNDWWRYDFTLSTWQQMNSLPSPERQYASSCTYENKIFVAGGITNGGNTTSEIWMYNTETDEWLLETYFPGGGRQAPVIVNVYDNLYMGLGRNGSTYYNDWWKYNLHTQVWEQLLPSPLDHRYDAEAIEVGGKILIGLGKDSTQCFNDWWEFNVLNNVWTRKTDYPGESCVYTAGANSGEWIIMYGGTDFSNDFSDECFAFRVAGNEWQSITTIPGNPRKGGAALSYGGNYFYVSGIDSVFFRTPEIWELDFSTYVANDIILYPNPAGDWLCSSFSVDYSSSYLLEVYSIMNGQLTYTAPIDEFKGCFYINDLAAGFYMARLKFGDTYFQSFRFLKE